MKKSHVLTAALAAAAFLAGCGGNEAGDQKPRVAFTQMINFGDSLSDVGSYDVGAVALQGGGHFSVNGQGATGLLYTNWTEFLAAQL
ncbi:MAG TPA: esterase, partial [Burkholderiaceae bacterium]